MGLLNFFHKGRYERAGFELYTSAVNAARAPVYFQHFGVPDTLDGRFDLVGLFASLVIRRLWALPPAGPELAQAVFDAMFADMDFNLRELGVGDISLPKRMRAMWEGFHGRALSYQAMLEAGDAAGLEAALGAQCLAWRGAARLPRPSLAQATLRQDRHLAAQGFDALRAGRVEFLAAPQVESLAAPQVELRAAPQVEFQAAPRVEFQAAPRPADDRMTALECSRPYAIDRMGEAASFTVTADAAECQAIAHRLGVDSVGALSCRFANCAGGRVRPCRRWAACARRCGQSASCRWRRSTSRWRRISRCGSCRRAWRAMDIDLDAPDEIPYAGRDDRSG